MWKKQPLGRAKVLAVGVLQLGSLFYGFRATKRAEIVSSFNPFRRNLGATRSIRKGNEKCKTCINENNVCNAEGTVQLPSIFHVPFPMHSCIFICCLVAFPLWIVVPLANPNHLNDACGKRPHNQLQTKHLSFTVHISSTFIILLLFSVLPFCLFLIHIQRSVTYPMDTMSVVLENVNMI